MEGRKDNFKIIKIILIPLYRKILQNVYIILMRIIIFVKLYIIK